MSFITEILPILFISLCFTVVGSVITKWKAVGDRQYPPGPPQWPIVGNAFQFPTRSQHSWLKFSEWSQKYGDVIYLNIFGRSIVVLHSAEVARELFDKRSLIYSSRPSNVMADELCGYNQSFSSMPYGYSWRNQRRIMAREFTSTSISRYGKIQEAGARKMAARFLENPDNFQNEVIIRIGDIIFESTYGYRVNSLDDPIHKLCTTAMDNFVSAIMPGAWMVDILPSLQYLPRWAPFSGFLQTATEYRQVHDSAAWEPFLWAKEHPTESTNGVSFYSSVISSTDQEKSEINDIVFAGIASIGGGLDTNIATILTFILAMALNPDVQDVAYAEIMTVVGPDRLPGLGDLDRLPYIWSLIAESIRWNPATPLAIPHALIEDDEYNGFVIPKGSTVVANVWHMLHDPKHFDRPDVYDPSRFRESKEKMDYVIDLNFGFGRRACPGQHFARRTLFMVAATILATMKIVPTPGVPLSARFKPTGISFPERYSVAFEPRSPEALKLISEESIN